MEKLKLGSIYEITWKGAFACGAHFMEKPEKLISYGKLIKQDEQDIFLSQNLSTEKHSKVIFIERFIPVKDIVNFKELK